MYVLSGNPIPLARPRYSNRNVWDCQKALKQTARTMLEEQHANLPLFSGPLILDVTFYIKVPRVKRSKLCGKPHIYRPDLSNLIKFVEDVANGILYKDDSIIAQCIAQKFYDEEPRTEFRLIPWEIERGRRSKEA